MVNAKSSLESIVGWFFLKDIRDDYSRSVELIDKHYDKLKESNTPLDQIFGPFDRMMEEQFDLVGKDKFKFYEKFHQFTRGAIRVTGYAALVSCAIMGVQHPDMINGEYSALTFLIPPAVLGGFYAWHKKYLAKKSNPFEVYEASEQFNRDYANILSEPSYIVQSVPRVGAIGNYLLVAAEHASSQSQIVPDDVILDLKKSIRKNFGPLRNQRYQGFPLKVFNSSKISESSEE